VSSGAHHRDCSLDGSALHGRRLGMDLGVHAVEPRREFAT
jgi:hypothetical protein